MQHSMEDKRKLRLLAAVVMTVLLVDQSVKFWIKTNMTIGEELYPLGVDWAVIHFVENPGMAFGLTFGGEYGKLALTWLRIIAVVAIGFALRRMVAHHASRLQVVSVALVLAGALGNIIDSTFYGMLFSASTPYEVAKLLPAEGGYAFGGLHQGGGSVGFVQVSQRFGGVKSYFRVGIGDGGFQCVYALFADRLQL